MSQCPLLQPRLAGTCELIVDGRALLQVCWCIKHTSYCQVYAVSVRIRRLDLTTQTHDCRWYDQMSSKLTILLNIQKVILKLASPSVMGKPTVATDSLIFHLIIHQADGWDKSEYLHYMGIWLQVVITLYKGHNNWHIDCSHGVSST